MFRRRGAFETASVRKLFGCSGMSDFTAAEQTMGPSDATLHPAIVQKPRHTHTHATRQHSKEACRQVTHRIADGDCFLPVAKFSKRMGLFAREPHLPLVGLSSNYERLISMSGLPCLETHLHRFKAKRVSKLKEVFFSRNPPALGRLDSVRKDQIRYGT